MRRRRISASVDDVVQASAEIQSVTGAERIQSLLPLAEKAVTGTGSTVDSGAATEDGGAAYLHVTSLAGTSVTATVQHSSNGSTWADLVVFDAQTEIGSQRKEYTGTVNRYLRTTYTLVGGAATFQVAASRDLPRIP